MTELETLQAKFEPLGVSCGYWTGRGVAEDWIRKYRLGYDEEKLRATIPWYNGDKLIGITGRSVTSDDVNSKFIGYSFARRLTLYLPEGTAPAAGENLLLVEGSLDAIKCRELGVKNVAAIYNLIPSRQQIAHIEFFDPSRITLLLDSDEAGRKSEEAARIELYPWFANNVDVIYCPQDGVDPWEYENLDEFLAERNLLHN